MASPEPKREEDAPASSPKSEKKVERQEEKSQDELQRLFDVPVKLSVILGRKKMKIVELLDLKQGSVFELDRKVGEPVEIFINDRLVAKGEIIEIEGGVGVTMTEICQPEND